MRSLRALLPACIAALAFAAPASAVTLQDAVMSKNVEYLGSIQQDVGLTTGAKVIGDRLFVTSGKNISIYDISDPATPKPLGGMKVNVAWENEEVPTNGKVLAVASDFYSVGVPECVAAMAPDGCVQFFDVRDPANIKQVGTIPIANHTAECALDCQYFYGKAGTIIDARGILDGTPPKVIGNWIDELRAQGVDEQSCHHIREIRPGVLLTACQPFAAISVNADDGGSPTHPKVLYTGAAAKFVHSARWPRQGADKFVLIGGEENFTGRCERNNSEFSVYSAEKVLAGAVEAVRGPARAGPARRQRRLRRRQAGRRRARLLRPLVPGAPDVPRRRSRRALRVRGRRALPADRLRRQHQGAGLLPVARQLVVVGEVGGQGRRPVLDRLPARDRHPALTAASTTCRARRRRPAASRDERRDAADRAQRRAGRAAHRARARARSRRLVAGALLPGCTAHLVVL